MGLSGGTNRNFAYLIADIVTYIDMIKTGTFHNEIDKHLLKTLLGSVKAFLKERKSRPNRSSLSRSFFVAGFDRRQARRVSKLTHVEFLVGKFVNI